MAPSASPADDEKMRESQWPHVAAIFRSAPHWQAWEAQLPQSDGFSQSDSAIFFAHIKDPLDTRLASLRSQVAQFIVEKETDPNAGAAEKKAAAEFSDMTGEIDRAYVTAVSLLVLRMATAFHSLDSPHDRPSTGM